MAVTLLSVDGILFNIKTLLSDKIGISPKMGLELSISKFLVLQEDGSS